MRVLITGANGFIGKNLCLHLSEYDQIKVDCFTRDHSEEDLFTFVKNADFIFHLAGVNRPQDPLEFKQGNMDLTRLICLAMERFCKVIPVVYSSSIQAVADNPYGVSKRGAEDLLLKFSSRIGNEVYIYRLANVFGKWARPNYNSVVATFCHNVSQDLPIQVNDSKALVKLVYIDDVIESFLAVLNNYKEGSGQKAEPGFVDVAPQYELTVGALADQIMAFKRSRDSMIIEKVGTDLVRALYSTYVSYLQPSQFSYAVPQHSDERGVFVEMLKTQESGQFSFFTAHPGITRGGHYHHSKTEKFLVIKGEARFRFRHMVTGEFYELHTSGKFPEIVETVTGWTHDIANVGNEEMTVMLWANEIFDREKPDTYAKPVGVIP